MRKGNLWRGLMPYIVAVAAFFAVTAIYFSPQFDGKVLPMHDITQYQGAAEDLKQTEAITGVEPHWTGNMFGGMPAYMIGLKYDNTLVMKQVMKAGDFMGQPASLVFIAMVSFFIMLLLCGVNPWVGIVPAMAYGLSTYFILIIGAGHITKMVALAYAPMMVGAVFYTFRRNLWLGAALTALFAALEIASGHPQITYYFAMVVAAYWIGELVGSVKNRTLPRFAKATALMVVAVVFAVGANFAWIWYTYDHSKDTIRGGTELSQATTGNVATKKSGGLDLEYATAWSYGKAETFNLFIPDLMGGSSSGGFKADGPVSVAMTSFYGQTIAQQNGLLESNPQVVATAKEYAAQDVRRLPGYWGNQPGTAGPTYIGAIAIFLSILGLFLLKGGAKWWVLTISIIAIMLSWGSNLMWFTKLFFDYLPGYNKFRSVSMILVIVQWSVPFMAALMLNKLWQGEMDRKRVVAAVKKSIYITAGVALLFALFATTLFSFSSNIDSQMPTEVASAMRAERAGMLRGDSIRSLILVLLAAGVVVMFAYGKIKRGAMVGAMAILVVVDLVMIDLRYLPKNSFVEPRTVQVKPTAADTEILADKELGFRVLNLSVSPFNDATTSYFHRSIGGYSAAKLQRYQDVITTYLSELEMNQNILSMLNTKYIIKQDSQTNQPTLEQNGYRNGAAWFVKEVNYVDGPDAEITTLGAIDLRTEAVVDRTKFAEVGKLGYDSTATISLVEYRADRLVYRYQTSVESTAIFSEIFYAKGWKATIDGVEADIFRANYILRGLTLPAGEHRVEFTFRAPHYKLVTTMTLLFSILIIAGVVAAAVVTIRCKKGK